MRQEYSHGRSACRPVRHRWEVRIGRSATVVAKVLLFFCLSLLPLFWGGRHPLATGTAGLCLLTAGIAWLSGALFKGRIRLQPAWGSLVLLAFCGIGLLQSWPLFSSLVMEKSLLSYWELVRTTGLVAGEPVLAALPVQHREMLLVFLLAALLYFLLCQLFADSREHLVFLAMGIAGMASVCALLSLVQHFGGEQYFFWLFKNTSQSVSGPYFNKNHLAQLQEMGLFTALGLLVAVAGAKRGSMVWRMFSRKRRLFLCCLFGLAFVLCGLTLVLTLSRAGIFCAVAGLAAFLGFMLLSRGKKVLSPVLLLLFVLLLVSFYGLDIVTARLELVLSGEDPSGLVRHEIWQTMREVIGLSPWFGTGFGSLRALSPLFDLSYMPGFITYDAHSDYLEFAVSLGVPCALCILALACVCIGRALRAFRQDAVRHSCLRPLMLGVFLAILVAMGHEVFDYGLKQPANLLVFLALIVVFAGLVRQQKQVRARERRHHLKPGRACYLLLVPVLALSAPMAGLYGNRVETGRELVTLDTQLKSTEIRLAVQPQARMASLIRQSENVLACDPENLEALNILSAAWMELAMLVQTDMFAEQLEKKLARPVSSEQVWRPQYRRYLVSAYQGLSLAQRQTVASSYESAVAAYVRMAAANPLNGLAYGTMAYASDEASAWKGVKSTSLPLYEVALTLYPWHTAVLNRAITGLRRAWEEEENPERRAHLTEKALELACRYSSQRQNMAPVYPMLWKMRPDKAVLIAMADNSIRGQEYLAKFFIGQGLWLEALQALDEMERLNRNRPEEETPQTLGNHGFLNRERRDRLVLQYQILQSKVSVLTALGREDDVVSTREQMKEVVYRQHTPKLERVDTLMAEGKYIQAEEVLKTMTDDGRALVRLGEILLNQGRYERLASVMTQLRERAGDLNEADHGRLAELESLVQKRMR